MLASIQDSIFLVTSRNLDNHHFGSSFVINESRNATYLITCAHVVRDVGGGNLVSVGNIQAEVVACGASDGPDDLAVLKVLGLLNAPVLKLDTSGKEGESFIAVGFQQFGKQFMLRPISGHLGKQVSLESKRQGARVRAWDLQITDAYNLEFGYSGAPIINQRNGCVIGVVSHRQGEGKKGVAVAVETIRVVWSKLPDDVFEDNPKPILDDAKIKFDPPAREPLPRRRMRGVRCPMCAEIAYRAKHYFIDWAENKKEFHVKLSYYCSPCHHRFDEDNVKKLPLVIAEQSNCSCGSTLSLSDHSIRKIGDEIEIEAIYVCSACSMKKRSLLTSLIYSIYGVWKNVAKVEVTTNGLSTVPEEDGDGK